MTTKEALNKVQERNIIEMDSKVTIQVAIGSLLVCNKTITVPFYLQHADMTRSDWHSHLKSNHVDNYEFIKEVFAIAKKMKIQIKIQFDGPGISECTFSASRLSSRENAYCVDRFFNSWAKAWRKAMSAKGHLIDESTMELKEVGAK